MSESSTAYTNNRHRLEVPRRALHNAAYLEIISSPHEIGNDLQGKAGCKCCLTSQQSDERRLRTHSCSPAAAPRIGRAQAGCCNPPPPLSALPPPAAGEPLHQHSRPATPATPATPTHPAAERGGTLAAF